MGICVKGIQLEIFTDATGGWDPVAALKKMWVYQEPRSRIPGISPSPDKARTKARD